MKPSSRKESLSFLSSFPDSKSQRQGCKKFASQKARCVSYPIPQEGIYEFDMQTGVKKGRAFASLTERKADGPGKILNCGRENG